LPNGFTIVKTALFSIDHAFMKSDSYYNLARSYHGKDDYETIGCYYMESVKQSQRLQYFQLPYYGLGQGSYATLLLRNWNYFVDCNEKKDSKLETTHLEKPRKLNCKVLA